MRNDDLWLERLVVFDVVYMMIWDGGKKRKKTKRDKQIASCGNTASIINAFGFIRKGRMQLPLDAQRSFAFFRFLSFFSAIVLTAWVTTPADGFCISASQVEPCQAANCVFLQARVQHRSTKCSFRLVPANLVLIR